MSGCATLLHTSPPTVEIVGPTNITATNTHGQKLRITDEDSNAMITPEQGWDDSIIVTYGNTEHTVALAKRATGWLALDILSYGPGFFIDDITHSWYSYAPIYLHVDTSGKDFSLTSSNLLGEPSGSKRPELLLLGGLGFWMHVFTLPGEGALAGPLPDFLFKFQGGAGIDFYKKIEIFYLGQDDPSYNVNNPLDDLGIPSFNTDVTSSSIAVRYFFQKDLFVQGSLGYGQIEVDTFGSQPSNNNNSYQLFSNRFPVVGAGIGWAGDISYLALQYSQATKRYFVDGGNGIYNSLFIDIGMNLRF